MRRQRRCNQALKTREKVLGPDHPNTLISVSNLGLVLDCLTARGTMRRQGQCIIGLWKQVRSDGWGPGIVFLFVPDYSTLFFLFESLCSKRSGVVCKFILFRIAIWILGNIGADSSVVSVGMSGIISQGMTNREENPDAYDLILIISNRPLPPAISGRFGNGKGSRAFH